jgi:hypothetical protein
MDLDRRRSVLVRMTETGEIAAVGAQPPRGQLGEHLDLEQGGDQPVAPRGKVLALSSSLGLSVVSHDVYSGASRGH